MRLTLHIDVTWKRSWKRRRDDWSHSSKHHPYVIHIIVEQRILFNCRRYTLSSPLITPQKYNKTGRYLLCANKKYCRNSIIMYCTSSLTSILTFTRSFPIVECTTKLSSWITKGRNLILVKYIIIVHAQV